MKKVVIEIDYKKAKKFLRGFLIFLIVFSWIFSGWPRIFNFPPKIQKAFATVGFDAASESHTGSIGATATYQWQHVPNGTPRGVLLFVFNRAQGVWPYDSVTYGGVAMAAVTGSDANGHYD